MLLLYSRGHIRVCGDTGATVILKNVLQLLKTRSGAINQLSPIEIN